jgi:hypothetical protein
MASVIRAGAVRDAGTPPISIRVPARISVPATGTSIRRNPMNREAMFGVVTQRIEQAMQHMFPYGAGTTNHQRVQYHLDQIAELAFNTGTGYALSSLMTVEDVAARLGVSTRRVRVIANAQHQRFGIGWQVPRTNQWLFRPEELNSLRPGLPGRPRKSE